MEISPEELGRQIGVPGVLVGSWERGRLAPDPTKQSALLAVGREARIDIAALDAVIAAFLLVERGDCETAGHSEGVANLSASVAARMEMSRFNLTVAGYLHDAGKIMIPPAILRHPGALSVDERLIVQAHVVASCNLARLLAGEEIARYIAEHHERLDGSGYPHALSGDRISRGGRIIAACDELDARISHRGYREKHHDADDVIEEMEQSGRFDVDVVRTLRAILREYPDLRHKRAA
jgi:HD-GYP domain-containing protein (c-di-GMP phosphodiesterase class II)